eukprot:9943143-Prorocentrum_lima.AAC.1
MMNILCASLGLEKDQRTHSAGTYFVGQGDNVLDVLGSFKQSLHYKSRSTPGEAETSPTSRHSKSSRYTFAG